MSKKKYELAKACANLTWFDEWGLEHVRKQRKHRVERSELGAITLGQIAITNAREELREDGQIQNERRSQQ
jgi:hypothetical protein